MTKESTPQDINSDQEEPEQRPYHEIAHQLLPTQLIDKANASSNDLNTIYRSIEHILAQIPVSVYWMNRDFVYLGCSNSMAKLLHLQSRQDIVGKTYSDLYDPRSASHYKKADEAVMDKGIPLSLEEPLYYPDGRKEIYLSKKVPLRDFQGEIIGMLGVSVDITDRKQMEEELQRAKEAAEAANCAKTEFLTNMRHDIRTPLSGIVGFSELLCNESTEPRIKEYAENLVASSHALLDLMDDVLEAVRVSSGDIPLLKRKFDLHHTLEQVVTLYRARALEKNLKLSLNLSSSLPQYVIGDKIRLHRIALELIGNALNFTDRGHVTIEATLAKSDNRILVIQLTVSDSGMGIPKDKQQEIYLQFKRLTPSYQGIYKGVGLGLYVVKQFIDELEGEIYVASELHQGTTFTCLIPLQEPLLHDNSGIAEEETAALRPYMLPISNQLAQEKQSPVLQEKKVTAHILVVEDNFIAQTVATALLSRLSCLVDIAPTGEEAISLCTQHHYDLIFMDIGLGEGMDGYEVTHHIRNLLTEQKDTPIIALTAHAGEENKQRCIEAGMDAVLTKPLTQAHASDILKTFIPSEKALLSQENAVIKSDLPDNDFELFQLEQFALFDEAQALKNCDNKSDMLKELLLLLVQKELPNDLNDMKKAFESQDYTRIEKIAHKIKGSAVYVCTTRMKYACQYLERYWKTGQRELFPKLYEQAIHTIEDTCIYLHDWFNTK